MYKSQRELRIENEILKDKIKKHHDDVFFAAIIAIVAVFAFYFIIQAELSKAFDQGYTAGISECRDRHHYSE